MDLDKYDDDVDIFPRQIQSKFEQSEFDLTLIVLALIFTIAMSVLFASIC